MNTLQAVTPGEWVWIKSGLNSHKHSIQKHKIDFFYWSGSVRGETGGRVFVLIWLQIWPNLKILLFFTSVPLISLYCNYRDSKAHPHFHIWSILTHPHFHLQPSYIAATWTHPHFHIWALQWHTHISFLSHDFPSAFTPFPKKLVAPPTFPKMDNDPHAHLRDQILPLHVALFNKLTKNKKKTCLNFTAWRHAEIKSTKLTSFKTKTHNYEEGRSSRQGQSDR